MAGRIYVPFMMFNARVVNMQHLWTASYEYLGKKSEKPNYFVTAVVPKTRMNWWEEPTLAANWAAYDQLLQKSGMTPQHVSEWPVKDGDMPPEPGKNAAEWAKGHWIVGGSSSNPIKVEIVQGANVVPLVNRVGVKPGDFIAMGLSAAVKQNNARALKHFCNTVLFMGPGEEIAVGNSVSGADMMAAAHAQGMQVVGFGAPGGFAQPQGGYPGGPQAGPGGFQQPQAGPGGFQQPQAGPGGPGFGGPAGPGFTHPAPGGAPTNTGPGQTAGGAFPGAPGQNGPGFGGPAAYPSNPAPGGFPGGPGGVAPAGPGFGGQVGGAYPGQR